MLSTDNQEEGREYHKVIKQGFAEKIFHEIKLDECLPNTIFQNIIFPYLTEQDIHYVAFIGQAGYVEV